MSYFIINIFNWLILHVFNGFNSINSIPFSSISSNGKKYRQNGGWIL